MRVGEYLDILNEKIKKNPEYRELEAVTSSDAEGNLFCPVLYHPTAGHFDKDDREFAVAPGLNGRCINAICLN